METAIVSNMSIMGCLALVKALLQHLFQIPKMIQQESTKQAELHRLYCPCSKPTTVCPEAKFIWASIAIVLQRDCIHMAH
jgi:hypothetical protein